MKKNIVVLGLSICLFILTFGSLALTSDIFWEEISRGYMDIRAVLVNPDNPRRIYIGLRKYILKTEDGGENWRTILSNKGENKTVNLFLLDPQDKNSIYAATGNGLFFSSDQGKNWKRVFQGKNYFEKECTTLAILPQGIYLGTKGGLFVSKDKGKTWHKETARLGNSHILTISYNIKEPNYIYIACVDGVFKTQDGGQSWKRIFVANPTEDNNDTEGETTDEDEEEKFSNIRYISIDPNNLDSLYLATTKGVYKSQDRGETWEAFSSHGLLGQGVDFLLISPKSYLYAITELGIFEYKKDHWQELSLSLVTKKINFLSLDNQNNLYAACDKGLFKAKIENFLNDKQDNLLAVYYKSEPKISEVQEVAMRYAEVEPEKIKKWRKQAAKRAFLPKVTISMDRDNNRTVSNSIWGTSGTNSSPGKYFVGPDDETKYNNKNWSVSLTWELGDLIWNDDQTSIDVRSRLMVQLRDDILDEVTKLYFERLRVKMELDNVSIEDKKKRFEKELRLQELTASLDALTGGYFSKAYIASETEP